MSELRAPDPTLDALEPFELLEVNEGVPHHYLPVAHRFHDRCDNGGGESLSAIHARWFAVPCRECFPDASEPGHPATCDGGSDGCDRGPAPGLAWQVVAR